MFVCLFVTNQLMKGCIRFLLHRHTAELLSTRFADIWLLNISWNIERFCYLWRHSRCSDKSLVAKWFYSNTLKETFGIKLRHILFCPIEEKTRFSWSMRHFPEGHSAYCFKVILSYGYMCNFCMQFRALLSSVLRPLYNLRFADDIDLLGLQDNGMEINFNKSIIIASQSHTNIWMNWKVLEEVDH